MHRKEIWILLVGLLLGVGFLLTDQPEPVTLVRPDYGEEDAQQTVYYERESGETGQVDVSVPARTYTKAELETLAADTLSQLAACVPGQNTGLQEVCQDVVLPDHLEEMPFTISWWSDTPELVSDRGEVYNDTLTEPAYCTLQAELRFADYTKTGQYALTVIPKSYSEKERFEQKLAAALQAYVQQAGEKTDTVKLPKSLMDAGIYSSRPGHGTWLFFPFAAVCLIVYRRVHAKQAAKEAKQAEQQAMLEAYPAFVNQLTLYMESGMTVRTALQQIVSMYRRQREQGTTKESHCSMVLCHRLETMLLQMQNGVSECRAYQAFGKDCGQQAYRKLMAILVQTVETGGKGVLTRLTELEEDAFVMRKEQARTRGEAASTKLLVPMILLLAVVMVLLIVPGFYGMGDMM